jgi:hypothetical protein
MTPIHSKTNPFRGINPHLNSFLQNQAGEWESFHSAHIVDLARLMDAQLPTGYFARLEKSLQIRERDSAQSSAVERRPRPDVTIYQRGEAAQAILHGMAAAPTLTAPVSETMDAPDEDEETLVAAVIYDVRDEGLPGKPVTRVELLSPTNKPPGEGYAQYRDKRNMALRAAMPLVEIDYLHQARPVIKGLPIYPDAPGAFAYSIAVSDPRPSLDHGLSRVYGFGVGDPLPVVVIPLAGHDVFAFDFGPPYHTTFASTRFYHALLDYRHPPERIERYSTADQALITARMAELSAPAPTPTDSIQPQE